MKNMDNDLMIIQKKDKLPTGEILYVAENPFEVEAFKHFSGGFYSITRALMPELVYVASLHGWTVTVEE